MILPPNAFRPDATSIEIGGAGCIFIASQRACSLRDGILVEAACARERGGQALAQHLWARVRRQAQGVEARAGRW